MSNLVSLTWPSLQIEAFSTSGILVKSLINKTVLTPETSNDIDMKLGPLSNLDNNNTTTLKNDDDVMPVNYDIPVRI